MESVNLGTGQGTNGCLFAVGHYFSQGSTATKRPPASVCNALRRDVAKTARGELLLVLQRDLKKTWSFCFGKNKILTSFTECITIGEQSGNEIFVTLDRLQEQVSKLRTAMLSTQSTLETSPNAINFKKHQLKQAKEAWDVGALNPNYTQQEKDENTHKTIEKELQILLERQEDAQQRIGDEVSAYNVAKDELEQFRQTNPLLQALCNFVATAGKYRLPDDDLLPSEGATLMVPLADWMTENLLGSLANSNLRTVQLAYLLLYTFCKTERSGQMATDLDVLFLTLHYKRNATLLIERNLGQNVRFSYADWQVKPLQDNLLLHKNDMLLVLWGDHYQAVTVHPKPPRQTGDQQAQTGKKISANIQWPDYDDEEEDEASEED
ncbi:MAG: hypothetical protein LBP65_00845 [Puniceicoccales bacterium]|nr:hypothetical protein [Puniceicoccales bacterium]